MGGAHISDPFCICFDEGGFLCRLCTYRIYGANIEGRKLVKRIAGCPGDEIDRRDLAYMKTVAIPVWNDPLLIVPDGCYFVLGDNAENSIDSRYWDNPYVNQADIVARILIN